MKLTVEGVREHFAKGLVRDPKKIRDFQEAQKVCAMINMEKFGTPSPKWETMSIKEKTWHGWLKPLVMASDSAIHGRWSYWMDIVATQEVEDKPIPKLNYLTFGDPKFQFVAKMLKECLEPPRLREYQSSYKTFEQFIDWLLYGFGSNLVTQLPSGITDELNEYWYKTFKADLMLMFPADYFVTVASQIYSSKSFNINAFYPTPPHVVQMMTEIVMSDTDPEKAKYQKMIEPCMGSGIMLLYASNYCLRLYGQDIDLLMCKIATINAFLYIPWMVLKDDATEKLLDEMAEKYDSGEFNFPLNFKSNEDLIKSLKRVPMIG